MAPRLTIQEMRTLAKERGGKCLSDTYVRALVKHKWQCSEGHVWEATPNSIKNNQGHGSWCPDCAGTKKLSISDMRALAKERGGECLSDKYENQKTRLKWKCAEGHVWESVSANVRSGHWCPTCAAIRVGEKKRLGIDEMHQMAIKRDGKCVSRE